MRFERKYEINKPYSKAIRVFLFCRGLIEQYPQRIVNSLYYDDYKFSLFESAQQGISSRKKVRIRFYDNAENGLTLENKHREGEINYKNNEEVNSKKQNLTSLEINIEGYNKQQIFVPSCIEYNYLPKILVSYSRQYFTSPDKKLRVTIDTDIGIYKIISTNKKIEIDSLRCIDHDIIELKYDYCYNPGFRFIQSLTTEFNLILSKSSKYSKGISKFYYL